MTLWYIIIIIIDTIIASICLWFSSDPPCQEAIVVQGRSRKLTRVLEYSSTLGTQMYCTRVLEYSSTVPRYSSYINSARMQRWMFGAATCQHAKLLYILKNNN